MDEEIDWMEGNAMSADMHDLLVSTEVAVHYGISVRTVERQVEQGLPAEKATQERCLSGAAGQMAERRARPTASRQG
jgi:hypothetical protein